MCQRITQGNPHRLHSKAARFTRADPSQQPTYQHDNKLRSRRVYRGGASPLGVDPDLLAINAPVSYQLRGSAARHPRLGWRQKSKPTTAKLEFFLAWH